MAKSKLNEPKYKNILWKLWKICKLIHVQNLTANRRLNPKRRNLTHFIEASMAAVLLRLDLNPRTSKQLIQNLMTSSERIDRVEHLCSCLPPARNQTKPQIEKQHMYVISCSPLSQLRHSDLSKHTYLFGVCIKLTNARQIVPQLCLHRLSTIYLFLNRLTSIGFSSR